MLRPRLFAAWIACAWLLAQLVACGSDPAPPAPDLTPEPDPEPLHVGPPEDELAANPIPPDRWREAPAPGHLRVLHRSGEVISWDEVEHPDPSVRARLATLAQEVSSGWVTAHHDSLGCTVALAHPSVVSFHCHAEERYRRTTSSTAGVHVGIADGRLFPFEAADVLAPRQTIEQLTRAGCRRQAREHIRDHEGVEAECDPAFTGAVLAQDGLHVHYPMTGTDDTIDVLVPFTDEARFRDGGPLAGLRGEGTPEPLPTESGPWAVSGAGPASEVIPSIASLPAAARDAVRLDGAPGGLTRYVLPEAASAEDAAATAAHFGATAHRVRALTALRPVTLRRSERATAIHSRMAPEPRQLMQGTLAWIFDPQDGSSTYGRADGPWAFTPVVAGMVALADFAPPTGCVPSPPDGDAAVVMARAIVDGRSRDVVVLMRTVEDELEVTVRRAEARCAIGAVIQTIRAPGVYEDVRLGSTEADGGVGLLVVGSRGPEAERAAYAVYRLGHDEPLLTAVRPRGVTAEGFLRLGETVDGTHFPITISHHPDFAGDAEPDDFPVRRFRWSEGRLVEAEAS